MQSLVHKIMISKVDYYFYNTEDIINWHYLGEINTELDDFGYMWECPDYFNVDNQMFNTYLSTRY